MSEEIENGTYLDYKHRTTGDRYEVFTANAIKEFSKKQVYGIFIDTAFYFDNKRKKHKFNILTILCSYTFIIKLICPVQNSLLYFILFVVLLFKREGNGKDLFSFKNFCTMSVIYIY